MSRLFATLAATLIAASASAGEITLEREIQAGSLHDGGVDMVVYYVDHRDHYEVVATYVSDTTAPARIRMALVDGDATTFGLPGFAGHTYSFSRTGDIVRVRARLVGTSVAQATN